MKESLRENRDESLTAHLSEFTTKEMKASLRENRDESLIAHRSSLRIHNKRDESIASGE